MANRSELIISTFFICALLIPEAEAGIISGTIGTIWTGIQYTFQGLDYICTSVDSVLKEIINPPRNNNNSIVYAMYTPDSPQEPCFLEQNDEALESCPFDTTYPLKFLIHGFLVVDPPLFGLKDRMLEIYNFNVVLVDWTRYNRPPYFLAAVNTLLIGHELANLIQFLEKAKGVDPQNVHLIGHSLGAHVAGVAGKDLPTLGRISGLDPAGPLFSTVSILHRLTYTDAYFVDVIHTSTALLGFGIDEPIGDQDFYPNGGLEQPQCVASQDSGTLQYDETAKNLDPNSAEPLDEAVSIGVNMCDHTAATDYFLESVDPDECAFMSVKCDSYKDFQAGLCSNGSNILTKMGLHAKTIHGLPSRTKFYLRTGASKPYCLEDGYEPE